jgi:hypothetical protein
MRNSIAQSSAARQSTTVDDRKIELSTTVDGRAVALSTSVDSALLSLRQAIDELGWTLDALAAHMQAVTGKPGYDKSLISRVLSDERPLTLTFLVALPLDVQSLYEAKRAEYFGHVVVAPLVGPAAIKAFVAGLVGVLGVHQLPARADQMARASLQPSKQSEVA